MTEAKRPTRKTRKTRSVRKTKSESTEQQPTNGEAAAALIRTWDRVISGVVEMEVETIHARLEEELAERTPMTGSVLMKAMDRAQENYMDATKLKNRARREYELFKIEHGSWLELKKTSARLALEAEKEAGKLKKQITKDMIEDQIRATWPTEFRDKEGKLRDFQAAVHTLEGLVDAWKARARTLSDLKDLVLAFGASGSRR